MHFNKEKRLQRKGTEYTAARDGVTHIKRYQELVEAECRKRGFHDDNTRELLPLSHGRNISRSNVCAVMAGFGFSPQDIIQGIAVARRICEAHFVQERRAGTQARDPKDPRCYGAVSGVGSSPALWGSHDGGNHAAH
jgi:hypothetical protein